MKLDRFFAEGDSNEPSPANEANTSWASFRAWHRIDAWDVTLRLRGVLLVVAPPYVAVCHTSAELASAGAVAALTCLPSRSMVRYVRIRLR
ncbi:hypothetical protein GXW82_44300 [Streptacidiphilus sp. 4-A2]|nr:hypothetical protein [Streptacidiphilus sp. 4-A2]